MWTPRTGTMRLRGKGINVLDVDGTRERLVIGWDHGIINRAKIYNPGKAGD